MLLPATPPCAGPTASHNQTGFQDILPTIKPKLHHAGVRVEVALIHQECHQGGNVGHNGGPLYQLLGPIFVLLQELDRMKREERGERSVPSSECSLKVGLDLLLAKHSNKSTAIVTMREAEMSGKFISLGYFLS